MGSGICERLALRPREAAVAIGVSPRTLWTWTKAGKVPHVRMGAKVLYPVELLREWLRSRGVGGMVVSTKG